MSGQLSFALLLFLCAHSGAFQFEFANHFVCETCGSLMSIFLPRYRVLWRPCKGTPTSTYYRRALKQMHDELPFMVQLQSSNHCLPWQVYFYVGAALFCTAFVFVCFIREPSSLSLLIILYVRDVARSRRFSCRGTEFFGGHAKAHPPARIANVHSNRCTMSCLLQSNDRAVTIVSPDWFTFMSGQLSFALLVLWVFVNRICLHCKCDAANKLGSSLHSRKNRPMQNNVSFS